MDGGMKFIPGSCDIKESADRGYVFHPKLDQVSHILDFLTAFEDLVGQHQLDQSGCARRRTSLPTQDILIKSSELKYQTQNETKVRGDERGSYITVILSFSLRDKETDLQISYYEDLSK